MPCSRSSVSRFTAGGDGARFGSLVRPRCPNSLWVTLTVRDPTSQGHRKRRRRTQSPFLALAGRTAGNHFRRLYLCTNMV